MDPRAKIFDMVRENADLITSNLHGIFHANIEDMVAGGIDLGLVVDAAFTVGVAHKATLIGPHAVAKLLRQIADMHEKNAGRQQ